MKVITYRGLASETEVPLKELDRDQLDADAVEQLSLAAGVDKYVASVVFGELSAPWRGHAAGTPVVRHHNSQGYHFALLDVPTSAAPPAPAAPPPSSPAVEPATPATPPAEEPPAPTEN